MKLRFVKKSRIVFVLLIVLFSGEVFAENQKYDSLDKTLWFRCLSYESCSVQAKHFKKNLSGGSGDVTRLAAYSLSSLLSLYLDDSQKRSRIDAIVEAENILYMFKDYKELSVLKSMISLVKNEAFDSGANSVSSKIIGILSKVSDDSSFMRDAVKILKDFDIPLLEYLLAKKYLGRGSFDLSLKHFEKIKEYRDETEVFVGWAEASLGANKNISKLQRVLKKRCKNNDCDWMTRALYLKLLVQKGYDRKVDEYFDSIAPYIIDGESRDLFLLEYANYLLSKNEYIEAEYYLNKAREINPENVKVYWALGRLYFVQSGRKAQSIAMLRHYADMMKDSVDRFKLLSMIEKYEKEEINN